MTETPITEVIHRFSPLDDVSLPSSFPSPFASHPHPLVVQAANAFMAHLADHPVPHDFMADGGGRILGVLVVRDGEGELGYLAGFSGELSGTWSVPGFVPTLIDDGVRSEIQQQRWARRQLLESRLQSLRQDAGYKQLQQRQASMLIEREQALATLAHELANNKQQRDALRQQMSEAGDTAQIQTEGVRLSFESQRDRVREKKAKKQWSEQMAVVQKGLVPFQDELGKLQREIDHLDEEWRWALAGGMRVQNASGKEKSLQQLFSHNNVPNGAGECAGPRMLQYAYQHNLTPLAMGEFWWGAAPEDEVRHHGHFYPSCRGRCRPILSFMLDGLDWEDVAPSVLLPQPEEAPEIVYEDEYLLVVNKPAGMLSVPGKEVEDSVLSRLRQRYPQATGALLVHRLDLSTSGLLLAAKSAEVHKRLQQQFEERSVEKRYVALLSKALPEGVDSGEISLPIRVDLDDRPRQLVCSTYGKKAVTRWRLIGREGEWSRVYFYPVTGRTHQLRIHAAHPQGLAAPIVGDELYGSSAERLFLHAERLCFTHPVSGERLELSVEAPF